MARKYTPAVFQPTVRPSWVGILSYISKEEQAAILEAILKFPNPTDINSRFWAETIEPDLQAQYETFTQTNENKGRASRDYWNKKAETMDTTSIPTDNQENTNALSMGEDMVTNSLPNDKEMVTTLKDKDKDKDKNKDKDKSKDKILALEKFKTKSLWIPFIRWLDYRKQLKKPYKSQMSLDECYNKLERLSEGSAEKAALIVTQSIAQGWQGLFELKEQRGNKNEGTDYNREPELGKYAGFGRTICNED